MSDVLLSLSASFLLSTAFTYVVRIIALKRRWISIPREERWNARHVALMGGIAVFLSFIILFISFGLEFGKYIIILSGSILMFAIGFIDDRFELKPIIKFLAQFLAASMLVAFGFTVSSAWPFWISIPLTYLWLIGITNAFNLLDNMDGLAAGIAAIVSFVFGGLALKLGAYPVAIVAFTLGGASGGFLVFNYNPAKIFMGDCGSLFIGYMLAALPLMLEPSLTAIGSAGILPLIIAITILPIFDTTLVTFVRIFKGRSPSQGGSDHSSHRLVFSGLSEKGAVNTLYGISAYFGAIALLFYPGFIQLFYIIFSLSIIALLLFGAYLARLDIYKKEEMSTIESMVESMPAYFKQKFQLVSIIVDVALIIVSLALSHFIRFEGWSMNIERAVINILPGVIVMKILILAGLGLYKNVWRYAGVADLIRLFIGAFLGTLASGIFAWVYMGGYISASVFAIDLFMFMFFLASSRFAFKGLRRLLAIPGNGGKNVLLYGAGDGGWLALSEIRQNRSLGLDPIGFLDDSPYKQKGKIQGLKVLGNFSDLLKICENYNVEEVLICIRELPEEKKRMVKSICNKKGVSCRRFVLVFDKLNNDVKTKADLQEVYY